MVRNLEFVIGTSDRCHEFARLCKGRVTTMAHESGQPFHAAAELDIEFAALTLFELKHPEVNPLGLREAAGIYHVTPDAFAPTVITAPLIHRENLDRMVRQLSDERNARGLPNLTVAEIADRITWSLMFKSLRTLLLAPEGPARARVGFHCETIGFFLRPAPELFDSFIEGYGDLVADLRAIGVEAS